MRRVKKDPALLLRWVAALIGAVMLVVCVVWVVERWLPGAPAGPVAGIDVSSHQGVIDWEAVEASGVEFAIVRLGYRGYGDGQLYVDERAVANLTGAREAGLRIGAYFFSQALDGEEARQEAELALEVLDGMTLDLPLAYDWEYVGEEARTGGMEARELIGCVDAFCDRVEAAGYASMVYFDQELSRTLLDLEQIGERPFWYARYTDEPDMDVDFWQWTDQGEVPGIGGKVDLDWYFPERGDARRRSAGT